MPPEGMVHALEILHRLLKPGGKLIDIHPTGTPPTIEVRQPEGKTLAGWLQETDDFIEYFQADEALARILVRGLFILEGRGTFIFVTHAGNMDELAAYLAETWTDAVLAPDLIQRAAKTLQDARGEGEVLMSEKINIARLKAL